MVLEIGSELNMIKQIYDNNFKDHIKSFEYLSRYGEKPDFKYLVSSDIKAFNFDGITKLFCKKNCKQGIKSADGLYFSKTIYFVEFKSGIKAGNNYNDTYIEDCIDKAIDTLNTHEKIVKEYRGDEIQINNLQHDYIVVMNSSSDGTPSKAFGLALAKVSKILPELISKLNDGIREKQKDLLCKFTNIDIWNDIYFDKNVCNL